MRTFIKSILFLGIVAFMFTSCEEDEFTEKDAMDQLQNIDVSFNVTDGSSYGEAIEGATVELAGDSTSSSKTTDDAGNVTFNDVPVGTSMSVYVHKEDFTKAMYNINTLTESYRENVVTENLKIYSLSGDNMATVKGKLTIESDLTNREREVLSDEEVRVVNDGLDNSNSRSFVGTTDEEGNYSIQVPVNPDGGDDLQVKYPSLIEKDQALAVETEDGTFMVDTVPAEFYYSRYEYTPINDEIPSAIAEVEAPEGAGSGFALGAEQTPTPASESEIDVLEGGSDYNLTDGYSTDYRFQDVPLSEDEYGNAAEVRVYDTDGDGSIERADVINDNDAVYTSAPTIDISSLEDGSGLELELKFQSQYKVFIENNGENYQNVPTVSADYMIYQEQDENNHIIVSEFDDDLNNINELGGSDLNDYLNIRNGSIYPSNDATEEGDTLFVTTGLTEAPSLTVEETSAEQAVISFIGDDISEDEGEITDAYIAVNGSGYDPANPPEITVTSLAGYGSGAELKAEVGTNGSIDNINVINAGEGYVWNVNDYDGDGYDRSNPGEYISISWDNDAWYRDEPIENVSPGDVETRNVYYGTGERDE